MFFTILLFAIVIVALVLALPYFSGLTTIEIDKKARQSQKKKEQQQQQTQPVTQASYGYIPPDEQRRVEEEENNKHSLKARASALKDKINVTSQDIPIKIKLNSENASGLRQRHKEKLDIDNDPNNYDYDLDDLIKEETEQAKIEQEADFYKDQDIGKEKEEMV